MLRNRVIQIWGVPDVDGQTAGGLRTMTRMMTSGSEGWHTLTLDTSAVDPGR